MSLELVTPLSCRHCNAPVRNGETFCCRGCEAVYQFLQSRGLYEFYGMRPGTEVRAGRPATPVEDDAFVDWSTENFKTRYLPAGRLRIYLEGVHCLGCLWLVESLPERFPWIRAARLDLGRSTATFDLKDEADPAELARELTHLGYVPKALDSSDGEESVLRGTDRREAIRLGIAGLCAGNIMLASIPLYSGAEGALARFFLWTTGILSLPVIFYCSLPFFRQAKAGLRNRRLSIDLPIALAVAVGGAVSWGNLVRGNADVFFDTLATIVFLLLATRLVLQRMQRRALSGEKGIPFASGVVARRTADGTPEKISIEKIAVGDRLFVRSDAAFPADGILRSPRTEIDMALLTGEPFPISCLAGEAVYAGTRNRGGEVEFDVTATARASRVGKILTQAEETASSKTDLGRLADKVATFFVAGVLLTAVLIVVTGAGGSYYETLRRVLTLSVVSCPCAFAFAVPLAFIFALRELGRRGILVKNAGALERLASCKNVFLDKTGTLTHGRPELVSWQLLAEEPDLQGKILALERGSRHPIARAIVRAFDGQKTPDVLGFAEEIGKGVRGTVGGAHYEVRAAQDDAPSEVTRVCVLKDGVAIADAAFEDPLRWESSAAVAGLRTRGLTPWLLSGDAAGPVKLAARQAGIAPERAYGKLSPEEKAAVVRAHPASLMVGDGANDSIALAAADVGVAVHGSLDAGLRSADIYLAEPGVMPLVDLVDISRGTLRVIRANLLVSLGYNAVGISLAATGHLSPLLAALLMPVSSATVLAITAIGMRFPKRRAA